MPRVNIVVDDVPVGGALPEDEVYLIEVQPGCVVKQSAKGPYVNVFVKVVEHPAHAGYGMYENLPLPNEDLVTAAMAHPDEIQRKKLLEEAQRRCFRTRMALEAFDVPYDDTGFDTDDLPGRRAYVRVKTETYEGKERSRISMYVPRV